VTGLAVRRILTSLAAAVLVLLGWQPSAQAATGSACLPSGGCLTLVNSPAAASTLIPEIDVPVIDYFGWQITVSGPPPSSAVFHSHLDPGLRVRPDQIDLNSLPADPSLITFSGRDFSLDLQGLLSTPTPFTIRVDFAAVVIPVSATLSSTADVVFDNAAHEGPATATSTEVQQHALLPDLALTLGAKQLTFVAGQHQELPFTVVNLASPKTEMLSDTLHVTVPAGFVVDSIRSAPEPGGSFTCKHEAATRWSCGLPHPGNLDTGAITVTAGSTLAVGTAGHISLTVQPGYGFPDLTQANNTATAVLRIVPAPAPATAPTPATAPAPSSPQLAATGPRAAVSALTAAAVLSAALGLSLVAFGRKRRS